MHSPGSMHSLPHIHPVPLPHCAHPSTHCGAFGSLSTKLPLTRSHSGYLYTPSGVIVGLAAPGVFSKLNSWSLCLHHRTQIFFFFLMNKYGNLQIFIFIFLARSQFIGAIMFGWYYYHFHSVFLKISFISCQSGNAS